MKRPPWFRPFFVNFSTVYIVSQVLHNLLIHDQEVSTAAFLASAPPVLRESLRELVECAEELADTAAALAAPAPMHIFKMAAMQPAAVNESFVKYKGFATVGRQVLDSMLKSTLV